MRQILYGIAVASLGLAVVVTLPTPPGAMRPSSGCRRLVMAPLLCHLSLLDRCVLSSRTAGRGLSGASLHHQTLQSSGGRHICGVYPWNPISARLLEQAKKMDQNSSVQLEASAPTVAPGGTLSVTVTTKGGIGPVVGIMLLDEPLRYQARPIQGTGWFIASAPEVIGPDGKPQSKWLDRRFNKQQTNLNFILVYDIASDPAKDMYATARVLCAEGSLDPWRISHYRGVYVRHGGGE